MVAEYLWIALWDPDRDDAEMLDACASSLGQAGARVRRTARADGRSFVFFDHYPALCPPDDDVLVEPARESGGAGGLVQLVVPADYFDEHPKLKPAKAWAGFRSALGRLLADVRPLLMVCPVELAVDELPDPPPEIAELLFRVGWVNLERLDEGRRRAFDRALQNGPRTEVSGGWWWSTDPDRDPAGRGAADPAAVARAVYGAWTNRSAPASTYETVPLDLPGALPELWFWAADRSDEQLIADVRLWATSEGHPPDDVGVGPNGLPGWFPVVLELGEDVDAATGLVPLRRAVAAVHPSWAALLPESGIAVPGLDPDIPSTGVLPNVWVNDAWIDGQRERLLHLLDGAHREELAGGVLIMTDPDLVPDGRFADWCYDPAARWDRLVDAAAVLAAAARASRPGP